jgi:carbon monoxide dehydrogenase subunit G
MELAGDYLFDAPQQLVWDAVRDPDVLGSILPGGQGIEEVGPETYQGKLKIRVGPVQGVFDGKVVLGDIVEPESYSIDVDAQGAPGFVKATGSLKLTAQGATTHMAYSGSARVGGRVASVGQRLLDASAKSIVRQSLDALNQYLQIQMAQAAAETAGVAEPATAESAAAAPAQRAPGMPPQYRPPSQRQLAFNTARDVADEMVPDAYRPILFLVAGMVLMWLFLRPYRPK